MRYFTFLLLSAVMLLSAAEFKVTSFEKAGNDLTAIQANVKDVNDELCGLVRIFTEYADLAFESTPSPMQVDKLTGELRVFLTPGTKYLMIRKQGYSALRYVFPQKIEPGVSYRLKLESSGAKLEDISISVISNPPGARIYLDGEDKGTDKKQKVSIGKHQLKVVKAGYAAIEKEITVSADQNLFEFKLQEEEEIPIVINSEPAGAKVEIDGIELGVTPLSSFYKSGKFKISLTKEGCDAVAENINIVAPKTTKSYSLKEAIGYLTINTHASATVYLNGSRISEFKNIKLKPQRATVKVTMRKAADIEQSVIIKRDDNITLDLYPEVATGKIQVAVIPDNASVELKDDGGQSYTSQGSKAFSGLVVGEYKLTVKADGYKSYTETVNLRAEDKVTKSVTLEKGADVGGDFVFVQGGTFKMGDTFGDGGSDEKPVHSVTVSDFYIGKYEVTQKEWMETMGSNPSIFEGDNLPIEQVSWDDCQEFIRKLNAKTGKKYRLPTEAEWEYAAKGGNKSRSYKYSGNDKVAYVAWYSDNFLGEAHPVGQKLSNELGIYDMSGNVREWCSDLYGIYNSYSQNNPVGVLNGSDRVSRGGGRNDFANYCRVSFRNFNKPNNRSDGLGFRLAMTP